MKIKCGMYGGVYIVFRNNYDADKWQWLFGTVCRMRRCCYGQYDNAYVLKDGFSGV